MLITMRKKKKNTNSIYNNYYFLVIHSNFFFAKTHAHTYITYVRISAYSSPTWIGENCKRRGGRIQIFPLANLTPEFQRTNDWPVGNL